MSEFRPHLKSAGVTEQQWRVLRALDERHSLSPNQLVERCQILGPSLTRILANLESSGLIKRALSEEDRRYQLVLLTETGAKLVEVLLPKIEIQYMDLEKRIGKKTMKSLYENIDEMLTRLERK